MSHSTPAGGQLRHEFVYLILAYNRHEQLFRLIRTLRAGSPNAAILLHFDAKNALPDASILRELGVMLVEPRLKVNWGDASQVDALLGSLAYALDHLDFSWLSVISGQDYPLRPLSVIEAELRATHFDAFVRAAPADNGPYRARYYLHYHTLPRIPYAYKLPKALHKGMSWLRKQFNQRQSLFHIEGGTRGMPSILGLPVLKPPFSRDFPCYKGSDWFTLSQRAAARLVGFGHEYPAVLKHFHHTFMPSEAYFQTVLHNCKDLKVSDDHRRYIVWENTRLAHPKTLTMQDLDGMVNSGKDFGRKFDPATDSAVLDALDRVVLER